MVFQPDKVNSFSAFSKEISPGISQSEGCRQVEVLQDIQMLFNKYYGPDRPDVDTNPYSEGNLTGLY